MRHSLLSSVVVQQAVSCAVQVDLRFRHCFAPILCMITLSRPTSFFQKVSYIPHKAAFGSSKNSGQFC
jgi:hypothetical protein